MEAKTNVKKQSFLNRLKTMAKKLKSNLMVLYFAYRDPRIPLFTKIFAICVVAYAFSPVDLIPDFIPILGYLDDLIIVPLGVYIALRLFLKKCLKNSEQKQRSKENLESLKIGSLAHSSL